MAETEVPESNITRSELLKETKLNAEADAIRHAEDLLEREFPIVRTAEREAESALAELRSDYTEQRGELEAKGREIQRRLEVVQVHLHQAENVLRKAGVAEDEMGLPPLQRRNVRLPQAIAAAGVAGAVGIVLSRLISTPVLIVIAVLVAIGLVIWLNLNPADEGEPDEMRRWREQRLELDEEMQKLQDQAIRNLAAIEQLERTTYSKGRSEIPFASKLVATYASAAFSSLPAGSLEGGREFAAQREPRVEIPEWLQALAPEDEE